MHGPFREAKQAAGINLSRFPWDTAAPSTAEEMGPSLLPLWLERETVRWLSEENLGQQSLGPATRAVPLFPRCHRPLGTAPPVLECTVASTVGEISELENHHLAFPTNTEHLNRIHTATVQEPQTIPRAACLGSFPTPRHRLPNSILSHTRIKPERPMSLTELSLISTSTSENKFGAQVSSMTDWQDYLTLHLKNRKCAGSRASLCFTVYDMASWFQATFSCLCQCHYYCSVCFPAKQPDRQIGLALDSKQNPQSKGQMLFLRLTCEHPKRPGRNNSICWLCSLNIRLQLECAGFGVCHTCLSEGALPSNRIPRLQELFSIFSIVKIVHFLSFLRSWDS